MSKPVYRILKTCEGCTREYYSTGTSTSNDPYCSFNCKTQCTGTKVNCVGCQKEFIPQHAGKKYCSAPCRKTTHNKIARATAAPKQEERKKESYFKIFQRDNFKCVYCGDCAHDGAQLFIDHIYPRSQGGGNDVFNLVTACLKCNSHKGDRPLSERATLKLWKRNLQLDIKFGTITSYETLKNVFTEIYKYKAR